MKISRRLFIGSIVAVAASPARPKLRGPQSQPEYPKNLYNELTRYGWWPDDALKAVDAFCAAPEKTRLEFGGARAAALSVAWMNDAEHDYSAEMYDCVMRWTAPYLNLA